jgi:hypothetical protein
MSDRAHSAVWLSSLTELIVELLYSTIADRFGPSKERLTAVVSLRARPVPVSSGQPACWSHEGAVTR